MFRGAELQKQASISLVDCQWVCQPSILLDLMGISGPNQETTRCFLMWFLPERCWCESTAADLGPFGCCHARRLQEDGARAGTEIWTGFGGHAGCSLFLSLACPQGHREVSRSAFGRSLLLCAQMFPSHFQLLFCFWARGASVTACYCIFAPCESFFSLSGAASHLPGETLRKAMRA